MGIETGDEVSPARARAHLSRRSLSSMLPNTVVIYNVYLLLTHHINQY